MSYIVELNNYDPWGNQIFYSGTLSQPIQYAGYYYDEETGLYYLKNRYYSPTLGRFLTKDGYEFISHSNPQTLNLYTYVGNNPVSRPDPTGHGWWDDIIEFLFGSNDDDDDDDDEIPDVPLAPPGVDIEKNIEFAKCCLSITQFYYFVRNGGPWDYKQQNQELYEDFGNFHFGATGSALGIPPQVLLRGAGWAQERAGTSKEEWGDWTSSAPYGDDPHDQEMIMRGIYYYYRRHN